MVMFNWGPPPATASLHQSVQLSSALLAWLQPRPVHKYTFSQF